MRRARTVEFTGPHIQVINGKIVYVERPATILQPQWTREHDYVKVPRAPDHEWQHWKKRN